MYIQTDTREVTNLSSYPIIFMGLNLHVLSAIILCVSLCMALIEQVTVSLRMVFVCTIIDDLNGLVFICYVLMA
jgi:hypothetical protein